MFYCANPYTIYIIFEPVGGVMKGKQLRMEKMAGRPKERKGKGKSSFE